MGTFIMTHVIKVPTKKKTSSRCCILEPLAAAAGVGEGPDAFLQEPQTVVQRAGEKRIAGEVTLW